MFRDERLDELNKEIVVIGGYNRAGKTSFMQLFRHLGFGFLENAKRLPKPNVEYGVNYDVEYINGESFNVEINGSKTPIVKGLNTKKDISIEELYGNIDYFTYKQLFTISLDELQNISLVGTKEVNNMQSILLGAGFKEIIHIPKFLKELQGEAKKIGGTKGNSTTGQFKIYNKEIKKGIELREKASEQVQAYYEKSSELEDINLNIEKFKENISGTKEDIALLGIIKNNFNVYSNLKTVEIRLSMEDSKLTNDKLEFNYMEKAQSLKEEYEDILYRYEQKKHEFVQAVGKENIKDKLLNYKEKLFFSNQNLSGITEKINNYEELKSKCIKDKENISKEILNINEEWKGDFTKILGIKTDIIEDSKLSALVEEETELNYKKRELINEIKNLEMNKGMLEKTFGTNAIANVDKLIRRCFYISLCIIVLGIILSFVNYNAGIILALSGAALGGIYGFIRYSSSSNKSSLGNAVQLDNLKIQAHDKNEILDEVSKELELRRLKLEYYRKVLEITEEISGETLKEYFRKIKEIKNNILNLQSCINRLNKEAIDIKEKLIPMMKIIKEFSEVLEENFLYEDDEIIKNSNTILEGIRRLNQYISFAEELQLVQHQRDLCEEKIEKLIGQKYKKEDMLNSLESYIENCKRCREIAEIKREQEVLEKTLYTGFALVPLKISMEDFKSQFDKFVSFEDVEEEFRAAKNKLKKFEEELEVLIEKRENIRYQLQNLYSTKNIEVAQERIDDARKATLPLAKRYATLRAAEYILAKLQSNFVDKTKDFLLKDASGYLSQITGGEYNSIQPVEDLMTMDFKTVLNDGSIKESSEILSRATKEQLFLSVRLSRIKDINPPLPIILDDSFVNFDEVHTKEVLKLLAKVSKSNQIFITTCHPMIVSYIGEISNNVQYLRLEKGKFNKTSKEELISYLQVK